VAFAACTAWLLVQNVLLISVFLGSRPGVASGALAVGRAFADVIGTASAVGALAIAGGAAAAAPAARSQQRESEAEHGHAR
jgi:hypothetical protein